MQAVIETLLLILDLYKWVVIIAAVMSWLTAFNVINPHNEVVRGISTVIWNLTEPVLRPIRSVLPNMGGVDLSPIVVIIAIYFLERLIVTSLRPVLLP